MQLSKRRENRGRFELANRADKLDQAQQEVDEVGLMKSYYLLLITHYLL